MMRRKWATAYQEAGHAVFGVRLGQRVLRASIVPDVNEGTLGHVQRVKVRRDFDWTNDYGAREWTIRRKLEPGIISAYAGVLAEKRYTGRRHNWAGASSDMQWAAYCILQLEGGGKVADAYARYLRESARRKVETWWPSIERVAAALIERETLKGDDIREAMLGEITLPESLLRQTHEDGPGANDSTTG